MVAVVRPELLCLRWEESKRLARRPCLAASSSPSKQVHYEKEVVSYEELIRDLTYAELVAKRDELRREALDLRCRRCWGTLRTVSRRTTAQHCRLNT